MGCKATGGLEAFKRHPWFEGYDWGVFERKEATPPFEPDVRLIFPPFPCQSSLTPFVLTQSKKANFDATHELEELLLEDNPLKARKRNPNIDVSQLSDDYRMMETQYVLSFFPSVSLSLSVSSSSFLPYDCLRQPRKTYFVDERGAPASAAAAAASSTSTDSPVPGSSATVPSTPTAIHPQAIRIDEQPMAELSLSRPQTAGSIGGGRAASLLSEREAESGRGSPAIPRLGTPVDQRRQAEGYEMHERQGSPYQQQQERLSPRDSPHLTVGSAQ